MNHLKDFNEELKEIKEALENELPNAEELLYDLEKRIEMEMDMEHDPKYIFRFKKLLNKINHLKKQLYFFDENTMLDYLYPNGLDED